MTVNNLRTLTIIYRTENAVEQSKLSSIPYLHRNLWVRRLISSVARTYVVNTVTAVWFWSDDIR